MLELGAIETMTNPETIEPMMKPEILISAFALLTSIVSFFLSYRLNLRGGRTARQPVLVFEFAQDDGWYVHNVGNGPALNIVLAFKGKSSGWKHFVRIPALSENSKFKIAWIGTLNVWILGAVYVDFLGSPYTTISQDDENHVFPTYEIVAPEGYDVPRYWAQKPISDATIT